MSREFSVFCFCFQFNRYDLGVFLSCNLIFILTVFESILIVHANFVPLAVHCICVCILVLCRTLPFAIVHLYFERKVDMFPYRIS